MSIIYNPLKGNGFNTQPPEGGWLGKTPEIAGTASFNTQPPEGGWLPALETAKVLLLFQHTAA